ncbi:hypothetical protein V6N12_076117 [Hibiscus sabdariffa]|uniref:Uncharacterized protein n=2 Tax=Hibiscus sabdariffa TaxID=183260 RepID=A0ABR2AYA5_9ROSI
MNSSSSAAIDFIRISWRQGYGIQVNYQASKKARHRVNQDSQELAIGYRHGKLLHALYLELGKDSPGFFFHKGFCSVRVAILTTDEKNLHLPPSFHSMPSSLTILAIRLRTSIFEERLPSFLGYSQDQEQFFQQLGTKAIRVLSQGSRSKERNPRKAFAGSYCLWTLKREEATYSRSEDGDLPLPVLDNSTAAHTAIALADLSSGMIISSLSSVPPSESLVVSWTSISMCLVAVCNSTSVVPARLSYLLQFDYKPKDKKSYPVCALVFPASIFGGRPPYLSLKASMRSYHQKQKEDAKIKVRSELIKELEIRMEEAEYRQTNPYQEKKEKATSVHESAYTENTEVSCYFPVIVPLAKDALVADVSNGATGTKISLPSFNNLP